MAKLTNNQYFLIIPDINLFPEIKQNTILMVEQIMNAMLLSNKDNIQAGVNKIIMLEVHCRDLLQSDYLIALDKLKPMLEQSNIHIAQGEEVRGMYPRYHKNKYYWDIGKQAAINTEFALEKKISYNGKRIIWENTYIDWVDQMIINQRKNSAHNAQDKLIFHFIEPRATNKHAEVRDIIEEETKKYAKEYRKYIESQKANAQ